MKALIVIDMLNDFVLEGAPLEVPKARKIIPNIKRIISKMKSKIPIIYICDEHAKNDKEFKVWPRHCVKGTEGAKIVKELSPQKGDIIIKKSTYSGFYKTNLDKVLKKLKVKELIVTGILTNICVFFTVFEARIRGYEVTVLKDCVAGISDEDEKFALEQMKKILKVKVK